MPLRMLVIAKSLEDYIEREVESEVAYMSAHDSTQEKVTNSKISDPTSDLVIKREQARENILHLIKKYNIHVVRNQTEYDIEAERDRIQRRKEFEEGFKEWKKTFNLEEEMRMARKQDSSPGQSTT